MLVNKNFLICLTGLPASGKTTFASKLKEILEKKFTKLTVSIIDPDIIRHTMAPNKFNYTLEPIVRERNLTEITKELSKGNIVISDDLNYYSSMRTKEYDFEERFKKIQNSDHLHVKSKILFLLAINDGLSLEEIKNSVNTGTKWLKSVLETLVKNEVVGYSSNQDVYYINL
ncbi:unnamed protein product [marine sediment metagenome]|uniref:Adenylyl-sulfate kinase n=1 Tax=marine sediment metagenome TaxID=412755 RepID=X1CAZ1_9ZZZZ